MSGGTAFAVNSGSMLVVNGSMAGGAAITVNSGATLAGIGSLGIVAVQKWRDDAGWQ